MASIERPHGREFSPVTVEDDAQETDESIKLWAKPSITGRTALVPHNGGYAKHFRDARYLPFHRAPLG